MYENRRDHTALRIVLLFRWLGDCWSIINPGHHAGTSGKLRGSLKFSGVFAFKRFSWLRKDNEIVLSRGLDGDQERGGELRITSKSLSLVAALHYDQDCDCDRVVSSRGPAWVIV